MSINLNVLMTLVNTNATGGTPIAFAKHHINRIFDFISVDGTPGSWLIQGSEDNSTWITISAAITTVGERAISKPYKYYRIFCTTAGGAAPVVRYYAREEGE